jgi:hypothetical protein
MIAAKGNPGMEGVLISGMMIVFVPETIGNPTTCVDVSIAPVAFR